MSLNFANSYTGDIAPPEKIVNGYEVDPPFKYPAMVSLFFDNNGKNEHDCGGTLYNGNIIITAAHCVIGSNDQWTAKVHRHDLSKSERQENGKTYEVLERIPHPNYNRANYHNDIAIWKIDAPEGKRTNVELDTGNHGKDFDSILTAIGWGGIYEGGPGSDTLLEVKLPVYKHETCALDYAPIGYDIHDEMQICAGYPEGRRDTCQGDSGGPLFKYENGNQILVGVTSFGEGCARPNYPGVYARISNYVNWINETIEKLKTVETTQEIHDKLWDDYVKNKDKWKSSWNINNK